MVVALAVLAAVGVGLRGFADWAWPESAAPVTTPRGAISVWSAGPGLAMAVLGGFRGAAADLAWLQMAAAWERRDAAATEAWLDVVTTIDPEPLYFWINGARILAYDVPAWLACNAPDRVRRVRSNAEKALRRLDDAVAIHAGAPLIWIERGNLQLNCLGDLRGAAASYRRAAELPGAPYYAARLHAVVLSRMGENRAAWEWLVHVHRGLPGWDPAAEADWVLVRIRDLESRLDLPETQRYRPSLRPAGGGFDTPAG